MGKITLGLVLCVIGSILIRFDGASVTLGFWVLVAGVFCTIWGLYLRKRKREARWWAREHHQLLVDELYELVVEGKMPPERQKQVLEDTFKDMLFPVGEIYFILGDFDWVGISGYEGYQSRVQNLLRTLKQLKKQTDVAEEQAKSALSDAILLNAPIPYREALGVSVVVCVFA